MRHLAANRRSQPWPRAAIPLRVGSGPMAVSGPKKGGFRILSADYFRLKTQDEPLACQGVGGLEDGLVDTRPDQGKSRAKGR